MDAHYVAVSTKNTFYCYGPFETVEKAKNWKLSHSHDFYGRNVHIFNQSSIYEPD